VQNNSDSQPSQVHTRMPASNARRESRKRKFRHLDSEDSEDEYPANSTCNTAKTRQLGDKSTLETPPLDSAVAKPGVDTKPILTKSRFICFVGNLPYSATDASLSVHFEKVGPIAIRHRTNKTTGKSRGFAFLEFAGYDRLKTCLALYHHSEFYNGVSPARKINVELTWVSVSKVNRLL